MARILLVEDDAGNRDVISRRLAGRGHQVELAGNGAEGVEKARRAAPELILMDMSMPVKDGWTATRELKQDPETRAIPVVAITAHGLAHDREKALAAGCDAFETKPIELPRLLATIESLLGSGAAPGRQG